MTDFNDQIVQEFRANAGHVTTYGFGSGLVLMHAIGARTGIERITPVAAIAHGDGWDVIASAAGSPKHPGWYFNLVAHPDLQIEAPTDDGIETVSVRAADLDGDDWQQAWTAFTERSAAFEGYTKTAEGRRFPILRLHRTA